MIYQPAPEQPRARNLYEGSQAYQGLESYSRERKDDPLAKRPGESDENHARRVAPHVKAAEAEADEKAAAEWEAHRSQVDNRVGTGTGIYGNSAPQERAAALGSRGFGSGRQVEMNGGLSTSIAPAPARVFVSQLQDGPAVSRSTIPAGSSGEGWIGADR